MKLNAQAAAWLKQTAGVRKPVQEVTVAEMRASSSKDPAVMGVADEVGSVEEKMLALDGRSIRTRVYTPAGSGPWPALIYFHGGGWVVADLDTHDVICRRLCRDTPCTVVSVEYRLAPEHPFPAAYDDAVDSVAWVAGHAAELNVDSTRMAVGGDSAGGNLAAAACLHYRIPQPHLIHAQVLAYPVLDAMASLPSYNEFSEGCGLTRDAMLWFVRQYVPAGTDPKDPRISPLYADSLEGLPPALVLTAECDVLRDEGERYAERLRSAGVAVDYHRYAGTIHSFLRYAGVLDEGYQGMQRIAEWLGRQFREGPLAE